MKKKKIKCKKSHVPNALTQKTIENAHKEIGISGHIKDIEGFVKSL